ncbi:MAG: aldose 1-epimerase family protein [Lachnospiraceae bacterium]|nr:aldose 1-epimerase family protein [Lachnospiraceae bacterium]
MFTLKNNQLELTINPCGAELVRVLQGEIDYLWNGDATFWERTSPVLFPIVGSLAQGRYFYQGQAFEMGQHGFARDMDFICVDQRERELYFETVSNEETRMKYPFDFKLRIGYVLENNCVTVKWEVENKSGGTMPFSIGAHPAFMAGPELLDYDLKVKESNDIETYLLGADGLIRDEKRTIFEHTKTISLCKELFIKYPTLILEGEKGMQLVSHSHNRKVEITFDGFPYVGIWSPINETGEIAPFVCVEPWFGMADTVEEPGDIQDKKGIQMLEVGGKFEAQYQMRFMK